MVISNKLYTIKLVDSLCRDGSTYPCIEPKYYKTALNCVSSDVLDVLVRFDPTYYTTTETKGSVTLWVGVNEAVNEPFTVALLPGESDVIYIQINQ